MNFDRFPLLVQIKILSFLNVKERLEIKSVSRLLKALIEQFLPLESLCIYRSCKPMKLKWPFTEEVIENQIMIQSHSHQGQHGVDFSKAYFRNLKRLHVHGDLVSKGSNLLKHINLLEELEVLSLYVVVFEDALHNINLRKLKVLYFRDCVSNWMRTVFFDMPNLISYSNFFTVCTSIGFGTQRFGNPEKLEVLRCQAFGPNFTVNRLTGLKHLICLDIENSFSLEELPSLKLLETFPSSGETIRILKNRERSFPKDLKVFVFGFSLANLPEALMQPEEFQPKGFNCSLYGNFLDHIAENYPKLERPSPWPTELFYSSLFESFGGRVPEDFFKFYPNIIHVKVSKKTDRFALIRLLKNHRGIEYLGLFEDCLDQDFFEELEAISSSLKNLVVKDYTKKVNFSFASKLENLRTIIFWSEELKLIPSDDFEPLDQCKNLREVSFYTSRSFAGIQISYTFKNCTKIYKGDVELEKVYEGECIKKAIDCINAELAFK